MQRHRLRSRWPAPRLIPQTPKALVRFSIAFSRATAFVCSIEPKPVRANGHDRDRMLTLAIELAARVDAIDGIVQRVAYRLAVRRRRLLPAPTGSTLMDRPLSTSSQRAM